MLHIKCIVGNYLVKITLVMMAVIFAAYLTVQTVNEERQAQMNSEAAFARVIRLIEENNRTLEESKSAYNDTILRNAEEIAYLIEKDPDILNTSDELRRVTVLFDVDEIHIFDKSGCIVAGTHPEYYGYTFDSGEQIGYFKPMLSDKSLRMVQDIEANTAANRLMQYSAVWSGSGEFIVQVGMEPLNILNLTKKYDLSHVFSLICTSAGVNMCAVDAHSGLIEGSTTVQDVGMHISKTGLDIDSIFSEEPIHAQVNGVDSYCVFTRSEDMVIGWIISHDMLYKDIPSNAAVLTVCLLAVAAIMVCAVLLYMNKVVIRDIDDINSKLSSIAGGDLDERVDVRSSKEFAELSDHINVMIQSLHYSTEKISYILNRTDLPIGVYEYSENMKTVRFTDYVPKILALDAKASMELTSDCRMFMEFMEKVKNNPVAEDDDVFALGENIEHYVKFDEIVRGNATLGIVIDVTEEIISRRKIEAERDIDLLTGIYNRRGLDNRLKELFRQPEHLEYGALIMIDADDLKEINDKYGHDKGDVYLKKIAGILENFGLRSSIAARQGGDEFVLFIYNYDDEDEVLNTIRTLEYIQNHSTAKLADKLSVPLRFSFGSVLIKGRTDYDEMLREADELMYESKRKRKELLAQSAI
ncbi:MAG: diguanylate cyclase [Oscillospiraceae bacterium]|nr:diguanylate cyclase [Oscillospiraceae bacterium]